MDKTKTETPLQDRFRDLVEQLPEIAMRDHRERLLSQARDNFRFVDQSIKQLPHASGEKSHSALVVCSGPSLKRQNSLEKIAASSFSGTIIAADGAYIACLKAGIIPDYVVTLDPHPSRIVRWFGDPEFEKNNTHDDYFRRQDLDISFRENSIRQNIEHIVLVDKYAKSTRLLICACTSQAVESRTRTAGFDRYWWNPLVDSPNDPDSLTKQLRAINGLPCLNTGGQCGTASYIIAATIMNIPHVCVVGMDCGYYLDTPYKQSQAYYELYSIAGAKNDTDLDDFFPKFTFPLTGEKFYTDPPYFRYRNIILDISNQLDKTTTYNGSEGGILFGPGIHCCKLEDFLGKFHNG